ncbi:right-handed parallel beta-helix repeat-containing protein [Candidatus Acetothermia bacterium]|nr:right-handed parallel beta-helix repeat-containing protein [Candidatus Acetothermia bacterium]
MLRFNSAWRCAIVLLNVALTIGVAEQIQAQTEPACTMNLVPGTSLQAAVTSAPEGAVICLSRGTWYGSSVLLAKRLTLRGFPPNSDGQLASSLQSDQVGKPILLVSSPNAIEVNLENLSITDAPRSVAISIQHGKIVVNLRHSEIARSGFYGIVIDGTSRLNVESSRIVDNLVYGILMLGSSQVTLTDSVVSGSKAGGIFAQEASKLTLFNSQLIENDPYGAVITDTATAIIRRSLISTNNETGLVATGFSGALIEDSKIVDNRRTGLVVDGNAEAKVNRTEIANHGQYGLVVNSEAAAVVTQSVISANRLAGVLVQATGELQLIDSQVRDNLQLDATIQNRAGTGIMLTGSSVATLTHAVLTGNGFHGLVLADSAQAQVQSSEVRGNGADSVCSRVQVICIGIFLQGAKAQLMIRDSQVVNNTDWGIAAFLKKCGFSDDRFKGIVSLQGTNKVEGNNVAKNHPGEICLP